MKNDFFEKLREYGNLPPNCCLDDIFEQMQLAEECKQNHDKKSSNLGKKVTRDASYEFIQKYEIESTKTQKTNFDKVPERQKTVLNSVKEEKKVKSALTRDSDIASFGL